jgi:hypothetical protein
MNSTKMVQLAHELAQKDVDVGQVCQQFNIHRDALPHALAREIRNGNLLGLSGKDLTQLGQNVGDRVLGKVIAAKVGRVDKLSRLSTASQLADDLERLQKKLHDRVFKGKPESRLVNKRKTKIPGFSTYFRKS